MVARGLRGDCHSLVDLTIRPHRRRTGAGHPLRYLGQADARRGCGWGVRGRGGLRRHSRDARNTLRDVHRGSGRQQRSLSHGLVCVGARLPRTIALGRAPGSSPSCPSTGRSTTGTFVIFINLGFLGTGALVVMFVVAIAYGIHWRSRIADPKTRSLLVSMIAALSASATSRLRLDALSFPMIAGLTFLLIGMIDSLGRCLHVPTQKARPRPPAGDLGVPWTVHGSDEEHPVAETLSPGSGVGSG